MNQLRFKIGARVIGREGTLYISEKVGTVIACRNKPLSYDYSIQFDEPVIGGHAFGLKGGYKDGHCRWVNDDELDPAPYFVDVKVGDSVYDWSQGEAVIESIAPGTEYPLYVVGFSGHRIGTFTLGGSSVIEHNQTLFYSKPVFELPPPPKRKVKKVIEGWENRYASDVIHATKEIADKVALTITEPRLGEAHFIRHEYEVEE